MRLVVARQMQGTMNIRPARTDKEIAACYPVMRELRPQIPENEFVSRVRGQEGGGYRLAVVEDGGGIVAIAGFRIGENLAWGRFLYVDDLVTSEKCRSRGYGARLLSWLRERAVAEGCQQLHLDAGIQREEAHRFYEREGMSRAGFHFVEVLSPDKVLQSTSGRDDAFLG
jgi:GNAT superfamily N-acetyltransferase